MPLPDDGPWSLCHFAGELVAVSAISGPWTVKGGELVALRVPPISKAQATINRWREAQGLPL